MRFFPALIFALFAASAAQAFTHDPVKVENGMAVTSQHLASDVGVEILKQGGNAIDAAVAVGYALAVTNPCCGNLGGGGFATLHLKDGRDIFLNFREKAPLAATPDMFLDAKGQVIENLSLQGYKAVAVPGTVMGLDALLTRYGSLPRAIIMAPAIRLASEGFVLTEGDANILNGSAKDFPADATAFLHNGSVWKAGDRLTQPALARTLQAISDGGTDAFYKGRIADEIVAASATHGGVLSTDDFRKYSVEELPPVTCSYRGFVVVSAPPPSSGGTTLCEILNILEGYPIAQYGFHSAQSVHVMVEAMRHAFVDRNFLLGDPDFVANPLERLMSKDYAAQIRAKIDPLKASTSMEVQPGTPPHEGTETTHYSVIDKAGNAVAVTYTINALFGAKVIAGDTGFFLNDEMDDFTIKPGAANLFGLVQGKRNAIQPGKRPLSSMSPTIVKKDGKVFMVLGSPGGSRIISIVLQVILDVVDHGMTIQEAVDAPRLHHQWLPDQITVEPFTLSADTQHVLEGMGYKIAEQSPWGAAESLLVGPAAGDADTAQSSGNDAAALSPTLPGVFYGGHDDRRPAGSAAGF
ncbi:gamma-glutamyltransferase [Aestuariivirga sp.]|uniref:gamma-glutamyltransferase n=1 Tax=Aestuariivirga sp. TaxID=2650926 RepID=UPI0039E707DE